MNKKSNEEKLLKWFRDEIQYINGGCSELEDKKKDYDDDKKELRERAEYFLWHLSKSNMENMLFMDEIDFTLQKAGEELIERIDNGRELDKYVNLDDIFPNLKEDK